ncbi:ATP-grasp domain-containing protein [Chamaesiphon sp. VAR_48_metabat_403]|uniref:ATP-grasp domain-containing protein n=1 Tax=Chamaesiphon sp. VAR_48_metabat_403 TaxID=2964700 RepID=UPI00286D957A|nr:ATP-grasp domain-containing protein [Chamaesiphon sp. VAR_48_metabat_403]
MVVVFHDESLRNPNSIDNRETLQIVETARMYGCYTYFLPAAIGYSIAAVDALANLPYFDRPQIGIWAGFIPSEAKYEAVYRAAAEKNVFLVNDPIQHQTALEFDRYYPLLGNLTPQSLTITSLDECADAGAKLGFPVFVRGAVKSNKTLGWDACVANDSDELSYIVEQILSIPHRARGRAIIRQLVKLRYRSIMPGNFPRSREYRLFVCRGQVLACGYYWDEFEDEFILTELDRASLDRLAILAAIQVNVPYIIVDIGQLESGDWIVIEIGDAQFAGMSHVSIVELWSKLAIIDELQIK